LADYFELCVEHYRNPVRISHWIVGEILGYLNRMNQEIGQLKISSEDVAKLAKMVDTGIVSEKSAKSILLEALHTGKIPSLILSDKGLRKLSGQKEITQIVSDIFKAHPRAVQDALENDKAVHFLMGLVMKSTNGRADPDATREIIASELSHLRDKQNLEG
jgi:aspartyl-tRNA(Asn)/glutamyl-tRNA(Gln) amidotransferase subunit B